MNLLCFCIYEIEHISHYLLHLHYFNLYRIDLMNSVTPISDNIESIICSNKITLLCIMIQVLMKKKFEIICIYILKYDIKY